MSTLERTLEVGGKWVLVLAVVASIVSGCSYTAGRGDEIAAHASGGIQAPVVRS